MSWRPRGGPWALLVLLLPLAAAAQSSEEPVSPKALVAIGVAPFERVAAEGASVPDVATLLADRLATKGVDRIVGPAELGAAASGKPTADVVLEWAQANELSAIVVGTTTRLGRSLSVDVQVRSAADGGVAATFVEEVARPADLGGAVERLAEQVLLGLPQGALREPVAAAKAERKRSSRSTPFSGDAPIRITAAQLEAFEEEGRKRLVFTDDVRASQADFDLRARKLEAFYPAQSSQPEKLVATGNVRLSQGTRLARCETATYFREDQRVVCSGRDAVLTQDEDQLQGREITFHLDSEILLVTGGATVQIQSEPLPGEPRP